MEESIIKKIIKEYQELEKYKSLYECQRADKQKMAEALYEYEVKEYNQKSYEQRVEEHIKETCKDCRWYYGQDKECKWLKGTPKERLPKNILEPKKTKEDFFPGKVICEDFVWDW